MNSKSLFNTTGLVSIAVFLLFAVLIISLLPSVRLDLTEDRLYSLSDGTRNIVANLERPVELIFFYSDQATEDVPQIRSYATRVEELLREIVQRLATLEALITGMPERVIALEVKSASLGERIGLFGGMFGIIGAIIAYFKG